MRPHYTKLALFSILLVTFVFVCWNIFLSYDTTILPVLQESVNAYGNVLLNNFAARHDDTITSSIQRAQQNPISISLFIRMSTKRKHLIRFYCNMLKTVVLFWPPSLGKMVIVLDQESEGDHRFAAQLGNQTREHFPSYIFDVRYEPLPRDGTVLDFPGKRNPPGYNRQLWSSFFIDLYTNDDIIAWLDTDSPFLLPVTMPTIMPNGKVKILGSTCTKDPSWVKSWAAVTEKAIGFPMVADFMTYFPAYIYRDTFTRCREHILKRFDTDNFEEAFKKFYHTGTGYICPVCVVISYAWYFEKDRYNWNIQTCGDVNTSNNGLPSGHKIQPEHVKDVLTQPQTAYHGPLKADDFYAKAIPITFCLSQAAAGRKPAMCEKHPSSEINYLLNLFKADMHSIRKNIPHPCTGNFTKSCLDILERHIEKIGGEIKTNSRRIEWEDFEKVDTLARVAGVTCPAHPV
ncbi:Hypothetical predicted protein [Paramuricea clavata]|uniref:Uncharacterized protein n=1 Tax=Paramuricea clavata TaxID=317549 RepID=A0A6S7JDD8_PARCT|nr:Hypothetical predicted protein [Paramuricea clavata]